MVVSEDDISSAVYNMLKEHCKISQLNSSMQYIKFVLMLCKVTLLLHPEAKNVIMKSNEKNMRLQGREKFGRGYRCEEECKNEDDIFLSDWAQLWALFINIVVLPKEKEVDLEDLKCTTSILKDSKRMK